MEGLLTLDELTKTLFESLKGSSAPGWNGFTVNWLRTFWSNLSELVTRALNEMYTPNELSGICKKALIKLLRKGTSPPFCLAITDPYHSLVYFISWLRPV